MPTVFENDDAAYEAWLRSHPRGYVLNCHRTPRASYLPVHRASCHTISGAPARGRTWTTGDYSKVCTDTMEDLAGWAHVATGGSPQACGTCAP